MHAGSLNRGEAEAASSLVNEVLVREPDNAEAVALAAKILASSDQTTQAVALLSEAASRIPTHEFQLLSQAADMLNRPRSALASVPAA